MSASPDMLLLVMFCVSAAHFAFADKCSAEDGSCSTDSPSLFQKPVIHTHQPSLLGTPPIALEAVDFPKPLLLTPMMKHGDVETARSAAEVLIDGISYGFSGYLSVPSASGKRTNHMWFWYQPCQNCEHGKANFLQYFAGGPGSGSQGPAFNEIGRFRASSAKELIESCFSWCLENDCLFVDNPVQAGLSYQVDENGDFPGLDNVEFTSSSEEATKQTLGVLLQFLELFPELKPAPYWITGESYAGNYCPWMAKAVIEHNAVAAYGDTKVNLKGLSVGDPCLGWSVQMEHYAQTLWTMGLLMEDEKAKVAQAVEDALSELKKNDCPAFFKHWDSIWNDDGTSDVFLYKQYSGSEATDNQLLGGGRDATSNYQEWLMKHSAVMHFAGSPAFVEGSEAEGGLGEWMTRCRKSIYHAMVESGDFCQETAPMYFVDLFLKAGIDVNIYSSNLDALLGPPTTEPGIRAGLEAAGLEKKFYGMNKTIWKASALSKQPVGYGRCMEGSKGNRFCYTIIRNAGHETPTYQAASAYDMTKRFIMGKPFDDTYHDPAIPQCTADASRFDVSLAGYNITN